MTTIDPSRPILCNYRTGDQIRNATEAERAASVAAAQHDGGSGVINVANDGQDRDCYVID